MAKKEVAGAARLPHVRVQLIRESGPRYSTPLRTSAEVYQAVKGELDMLDRERFLVLALDGKNRVVGLEPISTGTLTASLVHPREVFTGLILAKAAAFIVAHNHPSGDPTPSAEDIAITQRLREVGELLGIRLLDHVVLGDGRYCSFSDEGL